MWELCKGWCGASALLFRQSIGALTGRLLCLAPKGDHPSPFYYVKKLGPKYTPLSSLSTIYSNHSNWYSKAVGQFFLLQGRKNWSMQQCRYFFLRGTKLFRVTQPNCAKANTEPCPSPQWTSIDGMQQCRVSSSSFSFVLFLLLSSDVIKFWSTRAMHVEAKNGSPCIHCIHKHPTFITFIGPRHVTKEPSASKKKTERCAFLLVPHTFFCTSFPFVCPNLVVFFNEHKVRQWSKKVLTPLRSAGHQKMVTHEQNHARPTRHQPRTKLLTDNRFCTTQNIHQCEKSEKGSEHSPEEKQILSPSVQQPRATKFISLSVWPSHFGAFMNNEKSGQPTLQQRSMR